MLNKRLGLFLLIVIGGLALLIAAETHHAAAQMAPRDQVDADVLYQSDRNEFLVVWSEDRGAGHRIFAKRIRSNGLPRGGPGGGEWEITAAADPAGQKGDQRWPAVTDGLLVWSERLPGGTDYDLYAQRLFTNSRTSGKPKLVAGGPGDQKFADIARSRDTEWLVVWSEDTTDAGDVMGIRLSTALTPRNAKFEIAKGPGTAEDPSISRDLGSANYFLVLWTDDRAGNKDIFGARVAATGLPRGGSATTGHFPVVESPEDDYAPVLQTSPFDLLSGGRVNPRSDADTRSLLMWTRDTVTDGPDVLGLRLRSNGYGVGSSFTIAGGAGTQAWSAAALRSDGRNRSEWFAIWQADPTGTMDVFGVEIGLNGIVRRTPRIVAAD